MYVSASELNSHEKSMLSLDGLSLSPPPLLLLLNGITESESEDGGSCVKAACPQLHSGGARDSGRELAAKL